MIVTKTNTKPFDSRLDPSYNRSTITIFEPGRVVFNEDLIKQSNQHRELYARVGDAMGTIL